MVLISSAGSLVSFAAAGRLNWQYSAVLAGACLPAAALGTLLIARAVRRSGRASALVLLLAATIGLGCAVTLAFQARWAIQDLANGAGAGVGPLCA